MLGTKSWAQVGRTLFSEIQHPKKRAFLAAFMATGQVGRAASAARIDRSLIYTPAWRDDTLFQEAFDLARRSAADLLEDEAQRRAVHGVERYRFGKDGKPLRHPKTCECGHVRMCHTTGDDGVRSGPCGEAGCPCEGFVGEPYVDREYSDNLLMFTLKALKPDQYRETIEFRDSRLKINWHLLAAQPGGQQLIARIAAGEDYRAVLAGVLDQLREGGIIEYREPKRLGPGR